MHKEKFKWGIKINDLNALFQELNYRHLIYRHQFIYLRLEDMYQRNQKKKENYHVNAINDFLCASTTRRRDVKVKISNVNA